MLRHDASWSIRTRSEFWDVLICLWGGEGSSPMFLTTRLITCSVELREWSTSIFPLDCPNCRGKMCLSEIRFIELLFTWLNEYFFPLIAVARNIYLSLALHRVQSSSSPLYHVIRSTLATSSNFTALWKVALLLAIFSLLEACSFFA